MKVQTVQPPTLRPDRLWPDVFGSFAAYSSVFVDVPSEDRWWDRSQRLYPSSPWSPLPFLISDVSLSFIVFHWTVWLQPGPGVLSHIEEEKQVIFKNVFVVKSEMLKVDECAAPEEQNPSTCWSEGGGRWGMGRFSQNWFMPLFSWQNLFLFIETFIKLSMKRKQFLWRGRKKTLCRPCEEE